MYVKDGLYDDALAQYHAAIALGGGGSGSLLGELNAAHTTEAMGHSEAARAAFRDALDHAVRQQLPSFHGTYKW